MIKQRTLGPYTVSAIGMGCMPLSFRHERDPLLIDEPDRAIAVIHAAMDAGITLFDTADPGTVAGIESGRFTALFTTD